MFWGGSDCFLLSSSHRENLIFLPDFHLRMGLQDNAQLQCLPTSIPVKKLRILSHRYKSRSYEQDRPTEHSAVFLSKLSFLMMH